MNTAFNSELKQRLTDAGYSQKEIEFGAVAAQAKVASHMLKHAIAESPALLVPWIMVTQTMARALALASDAANVDAERVTAASDIIGEAAIAHARQLAEQSGMPVGERALDATPPADPKDVN